MAISVFDLFSVGIGPSSSHTVGPMRAGALFVDEVKNLLDLRSITRLEVDLYGSLAATGRGHGTLGATLLGLEGNAPETIDPDYARDRVTTIDTEQRLEFGSANRLPFSTHAIGMHPLTIKDRHTNTIRFAVHTDPAAAGYSPEQLAAATPAHEAVYYSVGGGFVEPHGQGANSTTVPIPLPFHTGTELLDICARENLSISDVMWRNEIAARRPEQVRAGLLEIWQVMAESIHNGFTADGYLPGSLRVKRRAPEFYRRLTDPERGIDHADSMDWLNVAAMAVNEENAGGGRIVTAPTNGAAGIVPAVLFWALRYLPTLPSPQARDNAVVQYLLAAAAIAVLYKERASISGAEVGCQGEVGSACSMAAGALAELLGATPAQVENAAEIGIEHNLGLTCDPIGGLVQIPCIERNAIASVKAVNAAKMALHGDGTHRASLDQAIETMRQTGMDMLSEYKETSTGGLAVNVPEC
ncbi:L-serine ammonia-lyase [Rhodococcus opacus]|uniref:L-serine dehydratase n=1 Tax=Rhodococcus opacus (strain B4) TaxID=632772 RepID=C1B2H0_RHOOB|nr:L-serine ammonia-lyase [Rhodococcus opacus]BAH50594.1 L-serine dehydratase [Rhodococcus opacus B4]